jgi:crotonobetainyl-CoA:carnitine CoA-transferase CaiB-like acyl-CoA transferase
MLLADLGAEVIKIESSAVGFATLPRQPKMARPGVEGRGGPTPKPNKLGITIDLGREQDATLSAPGRSQ